MESTWENSIHRRLPDDRSFPLREKYGSMKLFAVQFLAVMNLASALLSARAAADSLHPFRSEDGRFSIDFPAPSPSSRSLTGDKFSVTNNDIRHAVDVDDAEFAVEIHELLQHTDDID